MGLISTVFIFLPVALLILLKMIRHQNFIAFLLYYIAAFLYNCLMLGYISMSESFTYNLGVFNNLLNAPVMLFFLKYFATTPKLKKGINWLILGFIVFEVVVVFITGFNKEAIAIIGGPALLTIIGLSVHYFLQQTKRAIRSAKANGKALLTAGIIFSYCGYTFLFLLFYIFKTHTVAEVVNAHTVADTYLLYYLGTILSSSIICAGIIFESKRVGQLFELKVTRKELSAIYGNEKKAVPYRTAFLDFDKELLKSNTYPH